jgi:hypothetical protein
LRRRQERLRGAARYINCRLISIYAMLPALRKAARALPPTVSALQKCTFYAAAGAN